MKVCTQPVIFIMFLWSPLFRWYRCMNNRMCHSGGNYWNYFASALVLSQVTASHLKIGHPQMKSRGAQSSNELQGLDYMTGHQDSGARQWLPGNIYYYMLCVEFLTAAVLLKGKRCIYWPPNYPSSGGLGSCGHALQRHNRRWPWGRSLFSICGWAWSQPMREDVTRK